MLADDDPHRFGRIQRTAAAHSHDSVDSMFSYESRAFVADITGGVCLAFVKDKHFQFFLFQYVDHLRSHFEITESFLGTHHHPVHSQFFRLFPRLL